MPWISWSPIEELERGLRGMYRGEPLDDATEEALRDVLGDNAARDLSRLQRMTDELEQRGLIERDEEGMRLTARGFGASDRRRRRPLRAAASRSLWGPSGVAAWAGGEREEDTKPYEFGDVFIFMFRETLMNAVRRDADDASDLRAAGIGLGSKPNYVASAVLDRPGGAWSAARRASNFAA